MTFELTLVELVWDRKYAYKYVADSNLDWGENDLILKDYVARHSSLPISVNPRVPTSGIVIVSANRLVGLDDIKIIDLDRYAWLRERKPSGHIAYSWLVYEIDVPGWPRPAKASLGEDLEFIKD